MNAEVLVVDDDVDATFLLGSYFKRAGFESKTVHTIEDARAALADQALSVVLCDRQLGDGDGLTLFAAGRPKWIRWAVILSGEPTLPQELERASFDSSHGKPFDVAKLVAEVRAKLQ